MVHTNVPVRVYRAAWQSHAARYTIKPIIRTKLSPTQTLLDWLKASFCTNKSPDFEQRLRMLEHAQTLLDDLGTEHGTRWECTIIENLLNERYTRELPTILTSNT